MNVNGKHFQSIWLDHQRRLPMVIDQRELPFDFVVLELQSSEDVISAISDMAVRGAPLIGVTAACGLLLAAAEHACDKHLISCAENLLATRPTAINLKWAIDRLLPKLLEASPSDRFSLAWRHIERLCDDDIATNSRLGEFGLTLLKEISRRLGSGKPLNILTHCNAGWLATVDWGTALAPIFKAHNSGIPIHVWIDETRPRNQGASLTAWELGSHGVPYTLIADNAGGHLMQARRVDLCLVGSDRTTRNGDVCNKIGTYLKALAAFDNDIPFYAAVPSSSMDWTYHNDLSEIPIEERDAEEVLFITGMSDDGIVRKVRTAPEGSRCVNPAFDITPRNLITSIITDRGICEANEASLLKLYPEKSTNS